MSSAFLNGVTIKYSADDTTYAVVPEVNSFDGLGKTNPLVDVTSFDSTGREYIAGLADGKEITMECNYVPANVVQNALETIVNSGTNGYLEITITDGTTTDVFTFQMVPLEWMIGPSFEDKNTRNFVFKITGAITKS
jgi:hypothetical protein